MSFDVAGEHPQRTRSPSTGADSAPRARARSPIATPSAAPLDIVVLSHLRWDFVYQRPHHLMRRAAKDRRVLFLEEPLRHAGPPELRVTSTAEAVTVAVPMLPDGVEGEPETRLLRSLTDQLIRRARLHSYVLWYYTPMALPFTRHLDPALTVFDSMDELSAFRSPPAGLLELEAELLRRADVVFTGGRSLHEAKSRRHANAHLFPSSVDVAHFARARQRLEEPADQAAIGRPRLGYFGVIDERLDASLIAAVASLRPEWQIVMVGPVAKIDPATLPQAPNIHWLDRRTYAELPNYLAGWDVALMPFAHNEATRFISPTKTPEYLAAGRPVVSTSIDDVVQPYGTLGLVRIADEAAAFVTAIEEALHGERESWLGRVDAFLADRSWDRTWHEMSSLLDAAGSRPSVVGPGPATGRAVAR